MLRTTTRSGSCSDPALAAVPGCCCCWGAAWVSQAAVQCVTAVGGCSCRGRQAGGVSGTPAYKSTIYRKVMKAARLPRFCRRGSAATCCCHCWLPPPPTRAPTCVHTAACCAMMDGVYLLTPTSGGRWKRSAALCSFSETIEQHTGLLQSRWCGRWRCCPDHKPTACIAQFSPSRCALRAYVTRRMATPRNVSLLAHSEAPSTAATLPFSACPLRTTPYRQWTGRQGSPRLHPRSSGNSSA